MKFRIIAATCAALGCWMAGPASAGPIFNQVIPDTPGKSLTVNEIDYAPGQASPGHIHAKSAFIVAYVVSGAIESKVNDGEARVYHAGESWTEPGGAVHSICRNVSKTEPAKLLVINVVGSDDLPRSTPIK
jgi:quercetin dioxygenase-like cupin family protein